VNVQLDHLEWRSDRLRFAMTALYLALCAFVGTSLTLAIDDWLKYKLGPLPTLLAVAGVGSMLFASINLVREALRALGGNRREIQFYRELSQRRGAASLPEPTNKT
jgi:Protein of unknown function (DUF2721)